MARIKLEDLPVLEDLSPKAAKGIFGGALIAYEPKYGSLGSPVLTSSIGVSTATVPTPGTQFDYEEVEWTYAEYDDAGGSGDKGGNDDGVK